MLISAKTDVGLKRATNQDCFEFGQLEKGAVTWAVVCDGMGGMAAGHVASAEAVRVISQSLKNNLTPKSTPSFINNLLKTSIESANAAIYDMAIKDEALRGMGTTVVAVVIVKGVAYFAHVGDSRAYCYFEKALRQITTDHSVVQTMVDTGQITVDEAKNHPNKNIITRALGIAPYVDIDFAENQIKENEVIILCSDGLTNCIDDELLALSASDNDFETLADRLVDLANQNGGNDNITVVAVKI